MQTLVLKGTKPGNEVTVVRSKKVEDFLIRMGVDSGTENGNEITYNVTDPYDVYKEMDKEGILN